MLAFIEPRPDDLLSCMAALQLVRDAAEQCDPGMAAALAAAVMPRLGALLQHPEPLLQSGALKAAAALLGAALEAGEGPMAVDGPPAGGAANGPTNSVAGGGPAAAEGGEGGLPVAPLLGALKAVLDVGGRQDFTPELEDSALDAGEGWGAAAPPCCCCCFARDRGFCTGCG